MLLALLATLLSGCPARRGSEAQSLTPAEVDALILAIADQYAISGDVEMARATLGELNLANPTLTVLALAESYISGNGEPDMTRNLVGLAGALGPLSRMASDYLAADTGVAMAQAAQEIPPTSAPPTATPTDTPVPPTATATPEPTPTATFTPVPVPRVGAESQELNVRQGPGTNYPVVGRMAQQESAIVLGRNEAGSWWQVILEDGTEGWVVASLVETNGPMDAVEIALNVAPPPQQAPAPVATAAPAPNPAPAPAATAAPAPAPQPGTPFTIASFRLRPVGQDAQRCDGGDHNIFVRVVDAAGNPLDGVRVREIYSGQVLTTGAQGKGPGRVEYDIYRGGGGVVEIVDENNNPISPQSRGMSADWPAFDLMLEAGYCGCKPHPDPESCRSDLENKGYFFAVGHYVYEVTFQRSS